ncbi:OmpA family protein [Qipengyuania citrea]|nr:OmpA family protein [Qipengyuania citrea]MCZ4264263.1 OmpA family protein [Erythrobacter sp. G21629-S1]
MAATMLAGCKDDQPQPPSDADAPPEKRSIFRPEFQVEPIESFEPSGSLETTVEFPDGTELTEEGRAALATVLASPQNEEGGLIYLRGHTDSGGSDEANMRASLARAEAVRDWLVENGVAEDRIRTIAFGEQNPIAPNARPDGTPDEDGRTANRRVEIEVLTREPPMIEDEPTLAETLASSAEEERGESSDTSQ